MNEKKGVPGYGTKSLYNDFTLSLVTKNKRVIHTIRDSMEYDDSENVVYKLLVISTKVYSQKNIVCVDNFLI